VRVLIAHRSEVLRQAAWQALDRRGWEVVEADDPVDAVRLCATELPEVALLEADLAWPEGGSLIEHFRADERLSRARIVVFEDHLDFDRAFAGLAAGADEYLVGAASEAEIAVRVETTAKMGRLVAQLADQHSELRELIHTDAVTGLFNRRYLLRQISAQVNTARRHGLPLTLLLIDLDNFKEVNDTRGHAAGDAALRAVARLLEERLRESDVAGRWGGDEFLVLLPGAQAADGERVAQELVEAVRALESFPELTLSIGSATWEDDDPAGLVARADQAMYEVKRNGRDAVAQARPPDVEIRVAAPAAPGADRPPLRTLIVDDVEGIRSLLRLTLEGAAVQVVGEAADGDEAAAAAKELQPDLVIMDWNMPGADGLQGTRAVLREAPRARIVAFTSTDDPRIRRALLEAGACAHFSKSELGAMTAFLTDLHAAA